MQGEIDAAHPAKPVHILGINAAGLESGNSSFCAGRALPWLQDTSQQNVWGSWHAVWRDVYILDAQGALLHIYNLSEHDLGVRSNYAQLQSMLLSSAR